MKIALIGGHLTPALAVIDALPKDANVIFLGRKYALEGDTSVSLEYKTITERGIPFIPVTTGRMQRKITKHTFTSFFKIPYGLAQAVKILQKEKPAIVVGFGGYVSIPVALAAHLLRIPVVIHEQTLEAGLANKIIARFATKVCISWQHSAAFFPKSKTVLTGNPIRKFQSHNTEFVIEKHTHPVLYITGGSAGSHAINSIVEGALGRLLQHYIIIHQTGDAKAFNDYERLINLKESLPPAMKKRYHVTKFVRPEEVGYFMQHADLVVSRSGMNTVTELLSFGKPCLLIPLPYGQRNEQLKNAQFVKKVGIGDYVLQQTLTPAMFLTKIEGMVAQKAKYLTHASHAKDLVQKDAVTHIIEVVYEVARKKA